MSQQSGDKSDADMLATIDKLVRIGGNSFPCFDHDDFMAAVRARFVRPECGTLPKHTDDCAVHSPNLRPCSCGLETKLRDFIRELSLRLELAKADARTAHLQERELAGTVRSTTGDRERLELLQRNQTIERMACVVEDQIAVDAAHGRLQAGSILKRAATAIRALKTVSATGTRCPFPINGDDGSAAQCIAHAHCGCNNSNPADTRTTTDG